LEGGAAMAAMVKCVMQCKRTKCCPSLHLKTLNPHLEHTQFEAIFESEAALYTYAQGHSQVSSFGFGGTNGHGVFWGRNQGVLPDVNEAFMKRVKLMGPPEVRVMGNSPDDWESDAPDTRGVKSGAKFSISLSPDDMPGDGVKWVKETDGPAKTTRTRPSQSPGTSTTGTKTGCRTGTFPGCG